VNLISVIIPTFNRENTLARAIKSVTAQTLDNWELIIVDDGSTDRTAEVVSKFMDSDRIYYYIQNNKGVSSARNYGAALAKGDYLIFLDSDDEFKPELFEHLSRVDYENHDLIFWNLLKKETHQSQIWKSKDLGPLYNNIKGTFLAEL
jgi:glycosyltransferase involved in cell wall biosynthesis